MLIRLSGGREGIKEYLEVGHKQGREFSRDELDERVILAGDLDFTDQLIERVDSEGDRYLHITLAFKEDEIPEETLLAITDEFRKFMFSAYRDDEYNFYAEAHLPKIKSFENQRTGELVERKPHIHIVIPKINLLSGGALNPFGLAELCERHRDAFQEHINNKFGLASPKDNRRVHFTDASDMVQRYKADHFAGTNKEIKQNLLAAILNRQVTTYADFVKLVGEVGTLRVRNAGRDNEYLNVKPDGHAKGVNLKDHVFSRAFIELPTKEKQERLSIEIDRSYQVQGAARRDPATIQTALEDWERFRSKEIKYLNSGSRQMYAAYRAAGPDERERILAGQEARFYAHHQEPDHESERVTRNPFDHEYGFKRLGRQREPDQERDIGAERPESPAERPGSPSGREQGAAGRSAGPVGERSPGGPREVGRGGVDGFASHPDRQYDAVPLARFEKAHTLDRVRGLPGSDVVRPGEDGAVLLPHHAHGQLADWRARPHQGLRRSGHRQPVRRGGRANDSVVCQVALDFAQRQLADIAGAAPIYREIKQRLDASRLLSELSRTHGVIPGKYRVSTAADGSHRIHAGNHRLNVSDFLTKEMRLSWSEASAILRRSYGRQLDQRPAPSPRTAPDHALWERFQDQRRAKGGMRAQLAAQLASERARRAALRDRLTLGGKEAALLPAGERKAALSIARMAHVAAGVSLAAKIKAERAPLRLPVSEQYRQFLQELAQQGDAGALAELRRRTPGQPLRREPLAGQIRPAADFSPDEPNAVIFRGRALRYRVLRAGDVVYDLGGRNLLEDRGDSIALLQTDRVAIEAALRLAQQKFGNRLNLSGPGEFQQRAARLAGELGLEVTFDDKRVDQVRADRAAELAMQRQLGRQFEADQKRRTGTKKDPARDERTERGGQAGRDRDRE